MEGQATADAGAEPNMKHGNTLFVTRIPYNVTNTDLATFFSDIGPLRRAFVVTDKESHESKGVGYVTYTEASDAKKALDKLQGASIDGSKRHIQLQWADRKSTGRVESGSDRRRTMHSEPRVVLPDRDPDAVRTIVIAGLSGCSPAADTKTLYKRVRKLGDVEHVAFAEVDGEPSEDVAYVRFRTPNHAMLAVPKLHAHQFKGAQLSVGLKKRIDGAMRRDLHMRNETRQKQKSVQEQIERMSGSIYASATGRMSGDSRLIVLNFPFDVRCSQMELTSDDGR